MVVFICQLVVLVTGIDSTTSSLAVRVISHRTTGQAVKKNTIETAAIAMFAVKIILFQITFT